jgi:hypothetical protein
MKKSFDPVPLFDGPHSLGLFLTLNELFKKGTPSLISCINIGRFVSQILDLLDCLCFERLIFLHLGLILEEAFLNLLHFILFKKAPDGWLNERDSYVLLVLP